MSVVLSLAGRTVRAASNHRLGAKAAELSFFSLLALAPTLLAVLGAVGYIAQALGPDAIDLIEGQTLDLANALLSSSVVEEVVTPAVDALIHTGRADVIFVGLAVALWSGSRATRVLMDAARDAQHMQERRTRSQRRAIAVAITAVGLVASVMVFPVLIAGPRVGVILPSMIAVAFDTAWRFLYWPVVGLIGVLLLAVLYRFSLPVRTPLRRNLPGATTAAGIWLLGGVALRIYAAKTIEADSAYGPLGAPVVFLLWLYLSSMALLLGAELNSQVELMWPTREASLPSGKTGLSESKG